MEDDEEEVRTKLAADIEKYQQDASISTSASTNDVKSKTIEVTVDAIVSPIASGKIKLLEFIEALGPSIATKDPLVRAKSVRLLSLTLGRLAIDACLLDGEIDHLFQFLLARMQDHHLVAPAALLGLRALSCSARLPTEGSIHLLRSIFDHLDVQSLTQIDRFSVYVILRNLLAHHLREIQSRLGPNFVHGFIQTMDGEKDPRNLVICFQLAEKISQTFPLGAFAEDMFEVVACYFPIDFNPPKNDPFGITKEMLIDGLRKAMTASPLFAPYCLPLIIEKLASDLSSAKLDAVKTLRTGAGVFGAKGLREHLELLTVDLRKEMFTTMSETIQVGVEQACTSLTHAISAGRASSDYPELLPHFTALILKECGNYLNEPQHRLMHSASRFLLAFCKGSLFVTVRVIQTCFPSLHQHFMKSPQLNSRCPIVDVMGKFLTVLCDHVNPVRILTECQNLPQTGNDGSQNVAPAVGCSDIMIEEVPPRSNTSSTDAAGQTKAIGNSLHHPPPFFGFEDDVGELVDIRDPVLEVLQTCLNTPDERLCQLGIVATERCLRLPKAIPDEIHVKNVVLQLVNLGVFHASALVRANATAALQELRFLSCGSFGEENIFDAQVLPLLVNHLTEAVSKSGIYEDGMDVDGAGDHRPLLNISHLCSLLSATCVTPSGFATATDKLLTAIETLGALGAAGVDESANLGLVLLRALDALAEKGMDMDQANQEVLKNKVLPRIKSIFIDDWDSTPWLRLPEVVAQGAALLRKIVEIMTEDEAKGEWNETKGLLARHTLESRPGDVSDDDSTASKRRLFPILLSIGASVPRGCHIHDSRDFVHSLLDLATSPDTRADIASGAAKLYAAILNKIDNDAALTPLLDRVTSVLPNRLCTNGVLLWIWVTKAMVLRSHRSSKQFTAQLVAWLSRGEKQEEEEEKVDADKTKREATKEAVESGGVVVEDEKGTAKAIVRNVAILVSSTAFVTILADADDVLSNRQHAIARKMYKQRFFLQTIPLLIEEESTKREESVVRSSSQYRLNAVASMLPYLPQQALLSELPSILPVLVKSLSCGDWVLQKSVIKCLQLLLKESPLALASHTDSVIPKLLSIAQASSSMEVRAEALTCLREMVGSPSSMGDSATTGFAPSLLMPHKPAVVKELAKCIDDKKRIVRREAVLTRNKWYLI